MFKWLIQLWNPAPTEGAVTDLDKRARLYFNFDKHEFKPIDVAAEALRLNLINEAMKAGNSDLPRSDDEHLDQAQSTIIGFIHGLAEKLRSGCLDAHRHRADAFGNSLGTIENGIQNLRSNVLVDHLEKELRSLMRSRERKIRKTKMDRGEMLSEYEKFRNKHDLKDRAPEEISEGRRHFMIAIIALVTLLEAALNAFFFERGSERGLLGGIGWALLLAVVDVFIVFWLGFCLRWYVSRWPDYWLFRIISYTCGIAFLLWASLYNLGVAHVREALIVDPDNMWESARYTFEHARLSIQLESRILVALGVVFSTLAMVNGLNWIEKYPNFLKKYRRYTRAREEHVYEMDTFRDDCSAIHEHALGELQSNHKTYLKTLNSLAEQVADMDRLTDDFESYIPALEKSCRDLIKIYRDENRRHRSSDHPEPAYFEDYSCCSSHLRESGAAEKVTSSGRKYAQEWKIVLDEYKSRNDSIQWCDDRRKDIRECYNKFLSDSKNLLVEPKE